MFLKVTEIITNLHVGATVTVEFPYENLSIVNVQTPCDCADVVNNQDLKKLIVKYTPKAVPEHLKREGKTAYKAEKLFTISYLATGSTEVERTYLSIEGTVRG